jgi:hypothetical protein
MNGRLWTVPRERWQTFQTKLAEGCTIDVCTVR